MAISAVTQELEWARSIIKPEEVEKHLDSRGRDFIDEETIFRQLDSARNPEPQLIRAILDKSRAMQTLEPEETAADDEYLHCRFRGSEGC